MIQRKHIKKMETFEKTNTFVVFLQQSLAISELNWKGMLSGKSAVCLFTQGIATGMKKHANKHNHPF